jgi:hypothetical protein
LKILVLQIVFPAHKADAIPRSATVQMGELDEDRDDGDPWFMAGCASTTLAESVFAAAFHGFAFYSTGTAETVAEG